MNGNMPGAVIEIDSSRPDAANVLLTALFLGGDLILSQVCNITGLEPHVIQNWVARGYLSPPTNKRYSRRQLSRILIINMLRSTLSLDLICRLLSYVNGHLNDESDDLVDDSQLYSWLVELILHTDSPCMANVLSDYEEPFPGARRRVEQVLEIMLTAYRSSELRIRAEQMIHGLDTV